MKTLVAVLLLALVGCTGKATQTSTPLPTCTPSGNEICPTVKFLSDYQTFINLANQINSDLQNPLVKKIQAEQDELTGMQNRLVNEIPKGYQLNQQTMRLVPIPAPPAPPAPPKK